MQSLFSHFASRVYSSSGGKFRIIHPQKSTTTSKKIMAAVVEKKKRKFADEDDEEELTTEFSPSPSSSSSSYIPAASSTVSLNILQNGSFGFNRSVYLSTDTMTYMFNCPDTNRRLLSEQGLRRPPTIKHVFFTHGSWRNVSGLPGLAAFLKTVRTDELRLHGPPGLARIVNVGRTFERGGGGSSTNKSTKIDTERPILLDEGLGEYEDSNLIVQCVPFTITQQEEGEKQQRSIRADELAVAYICTLKSKWGKVQMQKCVDLGVRIGPDIGRLQRGQTVTNQHGESVSPDQVRQPPEPTRHFGLVEVPDERFLQALLGRLDGDGGPFSKFQQQEENNLELLVHFSPSSIFDRPDYQNWMRGFGGRTRHWVCNDASPAICHLQGAFRQQARLNGIHQQIFPLLWHHGIPAATTSSQSESGSVYDSKSASNPEYGSVIPAESASNPESGSVSESKSASNPESGSVSESKLESKHSESGSGSESVAAAIIPAEPFTKYSFRPSTGFTRLESESADSDSAAVPTNPPPTPALDAFRLSESESKSESESEQCYPRVTFLGTSSASPTKYRNLSGILLDVDPSVSILLDCGESTLSQLQLLCGPVEYLKRLLKIKAVFISHLHLDHHFGLFSLILERRRAFLMMENSADGLAEYENLIVLAASPLHRAHGEFSKIVQDTVSLCDFYSTASCFAGTSDGAAVKSSSDAEPEIRKVARAKLGLKHIETVKVHHPQCATGFVMVTENDDRKLVYSGDTRPCEELARRGHRADLLIHEATLNDGWEKDAVEKKHCTKSEAIQMARAMEARWTILTHFTGLNSKLPYVDERIIMPQQNRNVGLAFDFMTLRWDQLPTAPKLVPVIYEMYEDCVADQRGKLGKKRVAVVDDDNEREEPEEPEAESKLEERRPEDKKVAAPRSRKVAKMMK